MADHAAPPLPSPASPLVGRDRELAALREALAAALTGRGSLVLIGGEVGIGKAASAAGLRDATSALARTSVPGERALGIAGGGRESGCAGHFTGGPWRFAPVEHFPCHNEQIR